MLSLNYVYLHYILSCWFFSSLMEKWCNGDIIPDGVSIMVRNFGIGNFSIVDFAIGCCGSEFFPLWHILGDISQEVLFLRENIGVKIIPVYVQMYFGTSVHMMIQIWLVFTQNYSHIMIFFYTYVLLHPSKFYWRALVDKCSMWYYLSRGFPNN